ncbi:MAG TPA: hypothetical protein VFT22_43535 [Kofleriaceae bacterium]|nr:hypothetical protein [Kofleriaceae bacterium]
MTRLEEIAAYLGGELDSASDAAFEEAMFEAPEDPELAFVDRLARVGSYLVARNTFHAGLRRDELDALLASGRRVQVMDFGDGGRTPVRMDDDAELIVMRMGLPDAAGELGELVDVEMSVPALGIVKRVKDVRVSVGERVIWGICERPLFEAAYALGHHVSRVIVCRDGTEHVVAEYEIHPAPT